MKLLVKNCRNKCGNDFHLKKTPTIASHEAVTIKIIDSNQLKEQIHLFSFLSNVSLKKEVF